MTIGDHSECEDIGKTFVRILERPYLTTALDSAYAEVSSVDESHKGKYIGLTLLRFSVLETTSSERPGNLLTRSKPFKAIVKRAFKVCDNDQTGEINKLELYAGLLLVHLKLAKYAGPAACYVRCSACK
jgi:hypothetical protein